MVDLADAAADLTEHRLKQALEQRQNFDAVSETECCSCGEVIPEQRRALGGVKYCIECQTALEHDLKH